MADRVEIETHPATAVPNGAQRAAHPARLLEHYEPEQLLRLARDAPGRLQRAKRCRYQCPAREEGLVGQCLAVVLIHQPYPGEGETRCLQVV